MSKTETTQNWPELAIGLYDKLTGRGAEISYEMENLQIDVPARVGEEASSAKWVVNGLVKIRTRDQASA